MEYFGINLMSVRFFIMCKTVEEKTTYVYKFPKKKQFNKNAIFIIHEALQCPNAVFFIGNNIYQTNLVKCK